MAILTDYTTQSGEYREAQYVKVFEVVCNKDTIVMSVSHSNTSADMSYEDIIIEIPYVLDGPNPLVQSYDYLKEFVHTVSTNV